MENIDARLWVLAGKKLSGEATSEELNELEELLKSQGIEFASQDLLTKLWHLPLQKTYTPDIDKNWSSLSQNLFPEKSIFYIGTPPVIAHNKFRMTRKWLAAAAAVLLIATAGIGYYLSHNTKQSESAATKQHTTNQVASRNGSRSTLTLPDGTKVSLNAGSKIFYKNNFTINREITLTGEAYFDVMHDAANPFVIHAANVHIKVLGTAFNVKAYPADDRIETALVRGSVELTTSDDPERKILLRPNEKITILKIKTAEDSAAKIPFGKLPKKEELYTISLMQVDKKDNVPEDVAWMQDKLIFKGETFEQLAIEMERWYDVKLFFANDSCRNIKFTGAFEKQNIVQALQALSFSCDYKFVYSIDKNIITIKSNKRLLNH